MIQKCTFSNGGFVLHKIPYLTGTISAWYDENGKLVDADLSLRNGIIRDVPEGSPAWREASRQGRIWKSKN